VSVRALVVDDDDDIRFLTAIALTSTAGWEVVSAASGEEALALAREQVPDVVLMDLMMPGMDGVTTTARMRERPETADVPIVLFTARAAIEGSSAPWDDADISGVLTKPYDPMRLAEAVTDLLGWDRP
jgi:two-component system, OmpR family, response regulator